MPEATILPLELADVAVDHRQQRLLGPLSLTLTTGPRTIVMGPNGAGKSLLLRLCHGLIAPSAGTLRWAGPAGADPAVRRRNQAMVFQRPVHLRRSVAANVAYALSVRGVSAAERRRRRDDALARFGLAQIADRPARVLSGGEQQRLALARAWALRPEVLFLDEPTAALDPAAIKDVERAVTAFAESGTKIVMTTHDMGQARRLADEIAVLNRGRLVEHGPGDRVLASPASREAAAFLAGELVA